ncbi:MAG: sporulation initiation inhibitor Soj [Armatimonadetes bacterium CG07_land_8_20_14_0_80_40_9]|nr:MAG: sporulation initiation inhibitor Soj [Armatimonadetes bacterium CG07_land_8_20_14_0_80_40_9]
MAEVIALVNQKGGVGKTTTVVNLGAALSSLGKRVLLVDTDPQGNTTTGMGIERKTLSLCIYDVLINKEPLLNILIKTKVKGLDLIPARAQLAGAEVELVSLSSRETRLREILLRLKYSYDYILIDCPPSLGLLTINALVAADELIIPVQCEFYALEGLSQLLKTIELVRMRLSPELKVRGVLLTMFDTRTNLSKEVAEEIRNYFKGKVFQALIPRSVRLSEAPSFGQPVIVYAPQSQGAEAYTLLAKEVVGNEEIWTGEGAGSSDSPHRY